MSLRVAFVAAGGDEEDAAWRWLQSCDDCHASRFAPQRLDEIVGEWDVIWVHAASPVELNAALLSQLGAGGAGLLLTLRAASLVVSMGVELAPPNEEWSGLWHPETDEFYTPDFQGMAGYPHVRGLATWGPHPLVTGLHHGTYCWAPSPGERWNRCCYSHGVRPVGGRVVAVERAYITQNPNRVVAWEYRPGRGRILCVGAYVYFAAPDDLLRPQLEKMMHNALHAVANGEDAVRSWWPEPATQAAPSDDLALPAPLDLEAALPDATAEALVLERDVGADEQFDLAGRRTLLVGRERTGIGEIWMHPHRAVASWDVAADGDPATAVRIAVTPDVVERTLDTAKRRLTEITFVALEHAFALVEYHVSRKGRTSLSPSPARFEATLLIDLRRMWPFEAGCSGNLRFGRGADGLVALVESESGDGVVAVFLNRPAEITLKAVHTSGPPAVECAIAAPLGVPLRIAVIGAASRTDFDRTLRAVRRLGVTGLVRQRAQRAATLREARAALLAPEPQLPRALEWAKRRLDAFLGDVPGVGRSLLAGYAASHTGWGEGRPGYGWFFGRDACWSAFALLAAGEHSLPRQVIRFLGDSQDITGKVIHEVTTSGQHHYDAADSTPLYLLLVARYFAWTADREFLRSIWPHVALALAYCRSTDRDGDGLIENTRVGHGWIEGGPLGGAHVTLYLASVWYAALDGLARAAPAIGESAAAAECRAGADRARTAIGERFWDEGKGGYALSIQPDDRTLWHQTALHAVPMLLGAVDRSRCGGMLELLAGDALTAPWGVRMVPSTDPRFAPSGYHSGTVWPLFTGWASLAEYRAGHPEAGFRHAAMNAALVTARQLGAFDEVLHGLEEQGAGVCADQAWSAAMMIAPVVEGLFGVEPDAPAGRLMIAPALPEAWDWMELRGIRCAESSFDVRVRRKGLSLDVALRRVAGPPLWLTLAPWLRKAASRVEVDGEVVAPQITPAGGGVRCAVAFQAGAENELRFLG